MLERRRSIISVGGPRLPYDAELEYLQSVDKQRIVLPISCRKVDIYFQFTASHTQQRVLSARWSSGEYTENSLTIYQNGNGYIAFSMSKDWKSNSINYSRRCHAVMDADEQKTYVRYLGDGDKTITHSGFTGSSYIVLFDGVSSNTNTSRIYSCKLYDANGLRYDLIPVRVGSVGYLYNKVDGTLHGNDGTGAFVLGPDMPKEYTPAFFGIQSDGSAFIKTGFILPEMASIRGNFSEPNIITGNKIFFRATKYDESESKYFHTGFLYGGATSSSSRQALVYYDSSSYLNSKQGFLSIGTKLLNLWMTPYRYGTDSNSPNDQKFTKGAKYDERELEIAYTDKGQPSYTSYNGWILQVFVYGSEAKDVTTYSGFTSFTPVATFRACTLKDGTVTMWYVQGNRPCTVAGGGTFTAIN